MIWKVRKLDQRERSSNQDGKPVPWTPLTYRQRPQGSFFLRVHELVTVTRSMQEKAGDVGKQPKGSANLPRKSQCGKEGIFTPLDQ